MRAEKRVKMSFILPVRNCFKLCFSALSANNLIIRMTEGIINHFSSIYDVWFSARDCRCYFEYNRSMQ